jgi:hypothetical protein
LLQEQEGAPMISVDLRPGECNGGVAAALRGELKVAGAAVCGLSGVSADGFGVVRRRLRGSRRLGVRAGAVAGVCAGCLGGRGGRP